MKLLKHITRSRINEGANKKQSIHHLVILKAACLSFGVFFFPKLMLFASRGTYAANQQLPPISASVALPQRSDGHVKKSPRAM